MPILVRLIQIQDLNSTESDDVPLPDVKIELILPKVSLQSQKAAAQLCAAFQFLIEVPLPESDTRFPRQIVASMTTLTASNYFYGLNEIADQQAFETFGAKGQTFVGNLNNEMITHVENGRQLLHLQGLTLSFLSSYTIDVS